jgi:hypothetical protein
MNGGPVPARVPDLIEPLLGYRYWRVGRDGALRCMLSRDTWLEGANRASCWRCGHDAPGRLCRCGFNALHELPLAELDEYRGAVLGAIAAWGEVDVHRTGFRTQFAKVIALADGGVRRPARRTRILRAAERYEVPLVPLGRLPEIAALDASPIDPSLLPRHRRQPSNVPPTPL